MYSGNLQKRKKLAAELCQILRIVTIYIVINSTDVYQHMCTTISCRCCIAFKVMLLFLVAHAVYFTPLLRRFLWELYNGAGAETRSTSLDSGKSLKIC